MRRPAVIAYADDITVILRTPDDVAIVQEALDRYTAASGVNLNIAKSKAMTLGAWNTAPSVMGNPYHTQMRILGYTCPHAFTNQRPLAGRKSLQSYELRRGMHTVGISPCTNDCNTYKYTCYPKYGTQPKSFPPKDSIRSIHMTVSWYLWRGETFRVPLSTLVKRK